MNTFSQIEHLDRFFVRNLVVYPLIFRGKGWDTVVSLDEAINDGVVELKDVLDVGSISIANRGNTPLLVLEGESIVGARQDRIFNSTAVVEADSEAVVPVSCVEKNRWRGSSTFKSSMTLAFPYLRSVLRSSVTLNLVSKGKRNSDQNSIWAVVDKTLSVTRTMSRTNSMHDAYSNLKDEIERYTEELGELNEVSGYMVFVGDKFVSLDVFPSRELLKKYEKKLFASYAMQGILDRYGYSGLRKIEISVEQLRDLDKLNYKLFRGLSGGKELRTTDDILAEVVVDDDDRLLYASLVPAPL